MQDNFLWIVSFSLLSLIVNTIGIYSAYKVGDFSGNIKNYLLCFAAGILITSPLVFILPHAIEHNEKAGIMALAGFIFMLTISNLISDHSHDKDTAFGLTAAIAMGIHSFVDGIVYAVSFGISVGAGVSSGIGIVIHKFTDGLLTYTFLSKGNMEKKKAFLYAFLLAGIMTPSGAATVYLFTRNLNPSMISLISGFVAGTLIYTSASHLIPRARDEKEKHSIVAFISGVAFVFIMSLFHHH